MNKLHPSFLICPINQSLRSEQSSRRLEAAVQNSRPGRQRNHIHIHGPGHQRGRLPGVHKQRPVQWRGRGLVRARRNRRDLQLADRANEKGASQAHPDRRDPLRILSAASASASESGPLLLANRREVPQQGPEVPGPHQRLHH